ncbi:MAG: ABC transporter ATP-binding protein [Pseudonocardiaceae bacterium]
MTDAALEADRVSVAYRRPDGSLATVVSHVSLSLAPGQILGLVGESGCGKSSLALACMGAIPDGGVITSGSVTVEGLDLLTAPPQTLRALWGRHLAHVPQNPATSLHPAMRIGRQLAQPITTHLGLTGRQLRDRATELLDRVGITHPRQALRRYPHEFSGGQQQRIALALAISCDPQVLILDEPTTGLDVTTEAKIVALLTGIITNTGAAALYISHNLALVSTVADRLLVMYAGKIVESGATRDVVHHPRHPYTRALLAALPSAHERRAAWALPAGPQPTPILELVGVWYQYRSQTEPAVADLSLTIALGDTVAVVGESGSGKSTLLRAIAGLHPPRAGTIRFAGHDPAPAARHRSRGVRGELQLVFQNPDSSLNPRQSVGEILSRPIRLFRGDVARREEAHAVVAALDAVGLAASTARRYPGELSGGQRQRVAVARAFAARPALLLCDEVTSALDVSIQATILQLIAELVTTLRTTVVFVSHDLAVVRTICRRAVVLRAGRICEDGPTGELFTAPRHPYTRELIAAIPILSAEIPPDRDLPA